MFQTKSENNNFIANILLSSIENVYFCTILFGGIFKALHSFYNNHYLVRTSNQLERST